MGSASTASPTLHTPLCDLVAIRYPIIQAPMAGGFTTPELVAAVTNAGGLGMLAGMGSPPGRLRELIGAIRDLTSGPFGVNFLIPAPSASGQGDRDGATTQRFLDRFRAELGLPPGTPDVAPPPDLLDEQLDVVCNARVPIVSFALGDPARFVERAHAAGSRVVATVTTVAEAQQVAAEGVDLIVAQGAEAGGHQSTFTPGEQGAVPLVGTLALVPQVTDAVQVPVVASGGIMDGRGIVAALALGALGAQLGTRFLLAHESGTSPAHRHALLAANETDTVMTRAFTGRVARGILNRFIAEYERAGAEPLAWPLQRAAAQDIYAAAQARGAGDYMPLWAGQGLRLATQEQGAAAIVAELVAQACAQIERFAQFTS
jgi:nitronate monooxygenase